MSNLVVVVVYLLKLRAVTKVSLDLRTVKSLNDKLNKNEKLLKFAIFGQIKYEQNRIFSFIKTKSSWIIDMNANKLNAYYLDNFLLFCSKLEAPF